MAEWKKVIVSGSVAELAAVSASVGIAVAGDVRALTFTGDGSNLTGVQAGSINIDGFTAGSTLAQTDVFLYSDNGTEKKITFSDIEDEIFGNVSGDATIAAGGSLTIADTSVTNAMLAGSIANTKLSNDSVSFGGIEVELGSEDATPAFDLSDATNYPTTALVGTITNAQLAGSIANGKLANDGITIAGNDISLGGTITAATILDGTDVVSGSVQIESDINDLADARIALASVTDLTDVTSAGSGAIITSAERTKLSGIATGAEVNVDTDITVSEGANTVEIQSSTGTNDSIAAATTSAAGVMTATDKTKLDGIETSADVTDAANVRSAGALMDDEVTNLAQVKAFDSSDYATAAQGTTADNALPEADVDANIKTLSLPANTTISAFGKTLVDDASASAARTTLGLGSIATLSSIDISDDTNLTAGTGVSLTGDTLSIGQAVGTSDNVTFANITATGDLTVQGTLTSLQTTNLNVEDQLILLGSGSSAAQDQGIIFGGSTSVQGSGEAFFYDADSDRPAWSSDAVAWDATDVPPTAFIPRVFDVDGSSHTPIAEVGSIQVSGGDVFIYV